MTSEMELALALADKKVSDVVKEYIKHLPPAAFSGNARSLFTSTIEGEDIFKTAEDLGLNLADLYSSENYVLFTGMSEQAQISKVVHILEDWRKQEICKLTDRFQTKVLGGFSASDALAHLTNSIAKLPTLISDSGMGDGVSKFLKGLSRALEVGILPIIETPYKEMNRMFRGGFREKDIVIISAPTGGFKTMFAQNFARHWAHSGKKILYISTEMAKEHLIERWVLQEAYHQGIVLSPDATIKPKDAVEFEKIANLASIVETYPIEFCMLKKDINEINFEMRKDRYDIIIVDHLHLINGVDDFDQLAKILDVFNTYADENNSLIVLLAQNRKEGTYGKDKEKVPHLGMIFGSSQTINIASNILAIYQNEGDAVVNVVCLKDRHGRGKHKHFRFNLVEDRCYFKEVTSG